MNSTQDLKASARAYAAAHDIYSTSIATAKDNLDAAREKAKLDYEAACDAAGDVFDTARDAAFVAFAASPAYKADLARRVTSFATIATNKGKTK